MAGLHLEQPEIVPKQVAQSSELDDLPVFQRPFQPRRRFLRFRPEPADRGRTSQIVSAVNIGGKAELRPNPSSECPLCFAGVRLLKIRAGHGRPPP